MSDFDVIINNQFNNNCKRYICYSLSLQDKVLKKYIELLDEVLSEAIMSGEVHTAITNLKNYAQTIYDSSEIEENIGSTFNKFHSRIDEIDLYLYGRDYD